MEESRNQHQIIRKDNKNCFVESLSDAFEIGKAHLLLITKTHYEAWLAAWYLSQIQAANPQPPAKTRKAPEIPAQQPEPAIQSQYVMPEYSGKSLF